MRGFFTKTSLRVQRSFFLFIQKAIIYPNFSKHWLAIEWEDLILDGLDMNDAVLWDCILDVTLFMVSSPMYVKSINIDIK